MSDADLGPEEAHPADGSDPPAPEPGGALIGPGLGVVLGFIVLKLLPDGTAFILQLLAVVVVIAFVTYATLEITRRRSKR